MTFSVIVPFFNEEKYIRECIYSLLNQDFNKNEYELIFVNNGSTDGSEKIVKQFDSIIMIYEEKKNPYTARNRALEITKGSIIAFTDADCIVCPDWLRQIYRGIKDSNADIVLGKVKFFKKRSLLLRIAEDYRNSRIDYLLSHGYHRSCFGYTNNMAVKSHIFATLGVFKEWPVPGDTEIIQRCLLRYPSFKITYIMSMEVVHMELSTLATWIKKTFLHGRHSVLL
jgi:glycosyltransferase involved in cell wall biosynthesis